MIIKTYEQYSQMEEKVLGVDLDGVLNNFTEGFNIIYKRYFPNSEIVPAEDIDDWNWYEKLNYDGQDPQVWFNEHKHETWYVSLPYPGAVDAMRNVYEYTQMEGIILRIVTMQPTEQAKKEAVKWLTKYGIKYDDIAFVNRSKEKWDNAQVQVDDSPGVLSAKPRDRVGIKVETKYNTMVDSDFSISDITLLTPDLLDIAFKKLKTL